MQKSKTEAQKTKNTAARLPMEQQEPAWFTSFRENTERFQTKTEQILKKTEKFQTKTEQILKATTEKLDRLVDATPAAATYPSVLVIGTDQEKSKARRQGGNATWTYVTFQDEMCLVSSAHCLMKVQTGSFASDPERKVLVFHLSDEIGGEIEREKIAIGKVGFRRELVEASFQGMRKNPKQDIVFLELKEIPDRALNHETVLLTISPPQCDLIREYDCVVGTSLSGHVRGHGLEQLNDGTFTFLPEFCEKGNSGTVMFAIKSSQEAFPLGCFKGTGPSQAGLHMRGVIVPFPSEDEIQWLDCEFVEKSAPVSRGDQGNNILTDGIMPKTGPYLLVVQHPDGVTIDKTQNLLENAKDNGFHHVEGAHHYSVYDEDFRDNGDWYQDASGDY